MISFVTLMSKNKFNSLYIVTFSTLSSFIMSLCSASQQKTKLLRHTLKLEVKQYELRLFISIIGPSSKYKSLVEAVLVLFSDFFWVSESSLLKFRFSNSFSFFHQ